MNVPSNLPPLNHNSGASSLVLEQLAKDYASISETIEALAKRANSAPTAISDDNEHKTVATLEIDVRASLKNIEAQRVAEKAPYLKAEREIDGFFKQHSDRLSRIATAMNKRVKDYLDAKMDAERRAHEETARIAREAQERALKEAEEAAAANKPHLANAALDQAVHADQRATEALQDAKASPADLSRTRTDTGVLSTLKTVWTHEITDYDAIPLDKLRPYFKRDEVDKAIRGYVRAGNRELPGTRIFQETAAVTR